MPEHQNKDFREQLRDVVAAAAAKTNDRELAKLAETLSIKEQFVPRKPPTI